MRIKSANKLETSIRWNVDVYLDGLCIPLEVITKDGQIEGDHNSNLYASSMVLDHYFTKYSDSERKGHFEQIKKYIHNEIIDNN